MITAGWQTINNWFTDSRRFWILLAWVTAAVSIGKGLRVPNRWAATQALVDYQFGIVKRGLFGALFAHSLHLTRYRNFAAFSLAVLGLLLGLLAIYTKRSGLLNRFSHLEILVLFTSSLDTYPFISEQHPPFAAFRPSTWNAQAQ